MALNKASFFLFLLLPIGVFGQSDLSEEEVEELMELKHSQKGTYQIQMLGTRKKPTIPLLVHRRIEEKRKNDQVVYHRVDEMTRIKILPRSAYQNDDFEGVDQRVVHIQKEEDR